MRVAARNTPILLIQQNFFFSTVSLLSFLMLSFLSSISNSEFLYSLPITRHHDDASTRREFFREILYNNIAIIAIQHSKIYFGDTIGDFSHNVD